MGDLISRQAAIEALKYNQDVYSHNFHDDPIDKYTTAIIAADIDTLVKLPSAQPERKPGKWELLPISTITPVYKCSVCGRHAVWITTGCLVNRHEESYLSDFCPNCGAEMKI